MPSEYPQQDSRHRSILASAMTEERCVQLSFPVQTYRTAMDVSGESTMSGPPMEAIEETLFLSQLGVEARQYTYA